MGEVLSTLEVSNQGTKLIWGAHGKKFPSIETKIPYMEINFHAWKSQMYSPVANTRHVFFICYFSKNPFIPNMFFLIRTLFSTHVFYSQHVSFYLEHFFPPVCFIPNMFLFISNTFFPHTCSIWIIFHPCVLFPTCFSLFRTLFSTHVFYSQHVAF